jgi:hypothetical protein
MTPSQAAHMNRAAGSGSTGRMPSSSIASRSSPAIRSTLAPIRTAIRAGCPLSLLGAGAVGWWEAEEAEVGGMLSGEAQVALGQPREAFQGAGAKGAIVERPEGLRRLGVRQLGRIRQTHLDLLMQGTILAAIGAAVSSIPTWIGLLLVLGAYVAPLTLGILAFRPELQKDSIAYRGLNTAVLAGFTVAWVALAVTVISR